MMCENSSAAACPYDVGDILTTASSKAPSERWPGTEWAQIRDRFLLGVGDSEVGAVGGSDIIHLGKEHMPWGTAYDAQRSADPSNPIFGSQITDVTSGYALEPLSRNPEQIKYMPPYEAVFIWKRTK